MQRTIEESECIRARARARVCVCVCKIHITYIYTIYYSTHIKEEIYPESRKL